jgi:hypothetical protein
MIGGTAYVAGKAGAKAGASQAAEQQQAAEPEYAQAPPPAAPASSGMSEDSMAKLKQLAELHDSGVLTDAEFEVQKQKILEGM